MKIHHRASPRPLPIERFACYSWIHHMKISEYNLVTFICGPKWLLTGAFRDTNSILMTEIEVNVARAVASFAVIIAMINF